MLPTDFISQIRARFGDEAEAFLEAIQAPAPVSVRMHPHRHAHAHWSETEQIPWYAHGRYLSARPTFALDPLWHAGSYYVQEASSMILAEVVREALQSRIEHSLYALDLCAAPGGKSTLLLDTLSRDSIVVANEVIKSRVAVLQENIERWGYSNVAVTSAEVEQFAPLAGIFDLVLVDAPCSGEGMFRKDPDAASEWSLDHVQLCAARQQRILAGAVPLLAQDGHLIYSTCTYNIQENDENVLWLLRTYGLELVKVDLNPDYGFVATQTGWAAYPHRVRGEGFFIAVLRKPAGTLRSKEEKPSEMKRLVPLDKKSAALAQTYLPHADQTEMWLSPAHSGIRYLPKAGRHLFAMLERNLSFVAAGRVVGEVKGKDLIPDHALAMSIDLQSVPVWPLTHAQALAYLRKQDLSSDLPQSWYLVQFAGAALGWVKVLPNRVNNYLPTERRLRLQ